MYYNGYNQNQYQYLHTYPDYCGCQIYPVPFMPIDPLYAHAYVPYQSAEMTFPISEALMKGTIFPELTNLYDPNGFNWREEK